MRHLHKFHRIYHFKVRNLLEIERETIKFYEYFGKYSIDEAEFFGGIFVFLLPGGPKKSTHLRFSIT